MTDRSAHPEAIPLSKPGIPWLRFAAEAVLIVSSVYLAIVLEGFSQDREQKANAVAALSSLRDELAQDRAHFDEVLEIQEYHERRFNMLIRWLQDPPAMPADSFGAALVATGDDNRTIFPRSSSWATMVASGQLAFLGDPDLVSQLANFYEHSSSRVEHNGSMYDVANEDLARNSFPFMWNRIENRLTSTDPGAIAAFRGQLDYLNSWNAFYRDLIQGWSEELDEVAAAVDDYLAREGG